MTSYTRVQADDIDGLQSGPVGWFGRPVFLELRNRFERRALEESALWEAEGVPDGHGRPLLLIPGFLANPMSCDPMRAILERAGWQVKIAEIGRNSGPAYTSLDVCAEHLQMMADDGQTPVTIVGHSRGGQYGRILAVRHEHLVRQVVALGAPLLLKYPRFAPVRVPIELLEVSWRSGAFGPVDVGQEDAVDRDRFVPFPDHIGFVSVYSRNDGIVDWRASQDPAARMIEVSSSHRGLVNGLAGMTAVADALNF